MRDETKLTATQTVAQIFIDFPAVAMSIENPTASPIYLRLGASDTPSESDADRIIPAMESRVIAVSGQVFCAAIGNTSLLASSPDSQQVFGTATIILLSEGEIIPTFGNASFLSISTSQLSNGFEDFSPTPRIYDLGPLCGALIFLSHDSGSGQAWINLEVSTDGITYRLSKVYASWPGLSSVVKVPRIMRYLRMTIFSTGIAGEPNPTGKLYVRGTLEEVTDYDYNTSGTPITKTYALAASGSQQYTIFTPGLPSVSIAAVATAGTGASAAITLLVEASADLTNWRQVTFRTQAMSIGVTLYRSTGALDLYLRITVFEVGGVSAANGSIYISTTREPDVAALLNTIQQSLGDRNAPTNTNQDIYHELDTMRQNIATHIAFLDSIYTVLNTNQPSLPLIKTDADGIKTDLDAMNTRDGTYVPNLATIKTNTDPIPTYLPTIKTNTDVLPTNIPSMKTNLDSIQSNISTYLGPMWTLENANLPSLATYLPTIKTNTDPIPTYLLELLTIRQRLDTGQGGSLVETNGSLAGLIGAGVWTDSFVTIPAGNRIQFIMASGVINAAGDGAILGVGIGPAAGLNRILYWHRCHTSAATNKFMQGDPMSLPDGLRGSGYTVPANNTHIWLYCSVAAAEITFSMMSYP